MNCSNCGVEVPPGDKFCTKCGTMVDTTLVSATTPTAPADDAGSAKPGSQHGLPWEQFLEGQNAAIVKKVYERVSQILTRGEQILYICVQDKLINVAPDAFVLTNRRFIKYMPALLGNVKFEDYLWVNLRDARLEEGIARATITMLTTDGSRLVLDYLPKKQARRFYAIAQELEEHAWMIRRQRALEEKRASAGGVHIQGQVPVPAQAQPVVSSPPREDPVEKLKQLKTMLDAGLITQAEYDTKKQEILSRM